MNVRRVTFAENTIFTENRKAEKKINTFKMYNRIKRTKYDPQNCEICKISCNSKKIYDMHIIGKKHVKALEKFTESMFLCDICSSTFDDLESWSQHLRLKNHILAEQSSFSAKVFDSNAQKEMLNSINYCKICELDCGSNIILQSHLTGTKHKRKLKLLKIEKLKEEKDSSVYCDICEISLEPELMLMHKQSNRHKKMNIKENKNMPKTKNSMVHCAICSQDFSAINDAIEHYKSPEHLETVKNNENSILWCEVCKILLPSQSMLDIHLKGFRHYRILYREECTIEGRYKDKILNKKEKQRQLKMKFVKEKEDRSENDSPDNKIELM